MTLCSYILQGIPLGFGRFPSFVQGVSLASLVDIPVFYKGCPIGFYLMLLNVQLFAMGIPWNFSGSCLIFIDFARDAPSDFI